jgi:hypothetical protein
MLVCLFLYHWLFLRFSGSWFLVTILGGSLLAFTRPASKWSLRALAMAQGQALLFVFPNLVSESSLLPTNLEIRCATFFVRQIKQWRSYLDCFSALPCSPSTSHWSDLCARRDFFLCKHALPWLVIATDTTTSSLTASAEPVPLSLGETNLSAPFATARSCWTRFSSLDCPFTFDATGAGVLATERLGPMPI